MARLPRHSLCAILAMAVAACSGHAGYPSAAQDDAIEITANQPYFAADVRTKAASASDADRGGLSRQAYRDAVVYGRMAVYDIRYAQFEAALESRTQALNLGADLVILTLNGLGATTGASATKAALAAASAGVLGAKGAIDTDVFYQKTLPALLTQMRAARKTALFTIKLGLSQPADQYPLNQALVDLQAYGEAGTLPSALAQVTSQAALALDKATSNLSLLRSGGFVQQQVRQGTLLDRLNVLGPDQTLKVLGIMLPRLSERADRLQQALRSMSARPARLDSNKALAFLKAWLVMDDRSLAFAQQWDVALSSASSP